MDRNKDEWTPQKYIPVFPMFKGGIIHTHTNSLNYYYIQNVHLR